MYCDISKKICLKYSLNKYTFFFLEIICHNKYMSYKIPLDVFNRGLRS